MLDKPVGQTCRKLCNRTNRFLAVPEARCTTPNPVLPNTLHGVGQRGKGAHHAFHAGRHKAHRALPHPTPAPHPAFPTLLTKPVTEPLTTSRSSGSVTILKM